ncbi:hypothetical protein [Flavobacterium noncentrifugens]|uniref:Uncharacterized protein n=1 Tax=Flavobacterium noncentrifugens TaxID=1128970 RepID=A0A1G9CUP5_9FLAO|nr:hypothetical protein [Flavobacterium noncentrifugens]SDK55383.1 hypothetical protein SAMN04487935_3660 [Flavobacterium noncentrifugens]
MKIGFCMQHGIKQSLIWYHFTLVRKNHFFANQTKRKPKPHQNNTKPKHGMDAAWMYHSHGTAAVCFFKIFL